MFWPACHLVRGKPHHSESNGGVERSNRTVEDKLGPWMSENNSQHWSVSLPLVQWEMNTQTHQGIGGKIPYYLFTGRNPRVGISSLPIDPELTKKIYTEAQVSALLDLDPDIPLEDAVVKSYQTARVSGAVQELTVQPAVVTLTLPPIESVNIVIPPVAAVQESTANAPVSDLIENLFNRPHYHYDTHADFFIWNLSSRR